LIGCIKADANEHALLVAAAADDSTQRLLSACQILNVNMAANAGATCAAANTCARQKFKEVPMQEKPNTVRWLMEIQSNIQVGALFVLHLLN
jgi:hypothetical protein